MIEFLEGNDAVVRAAVEAGCRFFAGYPITPATSILTGMLQELPRVGGVAVQGEDEIASIGMCIGAAMTGLLAMTATSGPGMSLYSENLGLAIMGETPLVVVDVQRQGPATGSATKGADGDIQFLRWGTSGGLPLFVLSPENVAECYTLTHWAFELAGRFRTPVILASQKEVGLTRERVDLEAARRALPPYPASPPPLPGLAAPPAPGPAAPPAPGPAAGPASAGPASAPAPAAPYQPYAFARPADVPPFSPLGGPRLVRYTTSTHDQRGLLTRDPEVIAQMLAHLEGKILEGAPDWALCDLDQDPQADTLLLTYGVSARAAREALRRARAQGKRLSLLVLKTLYPVPAAAIRAALQGVERVLVVEMNLGQYVEEVRRLAGGREVVFLGRMNTELLSPEEILRGGGLS